MIRPFLREELFSVINLWIAQASSVRDLAAASSAGHLPAASSVAPSVNNLIQQAGLPGFFLERQNVSYLLVASSGVNNLNHQLGIFVAR